MIEPVQVPLKAKYVGGRSAGRNQSKHNDGERRAVRRRKLRDRERAEVQARQPLVTLVLLPSGKKRFVRTPRPDARSEGRRGSDAVQRDG